MMNWKPGRSRANSSLLIGLWLGLTAMVGVCVFAGLFWALGGFGRNAPASATAVILPTRVLTATAPPLPATLTVPSQVVTGAPACNFRPAPKSGFGYGIQSHVFVGDNSFWLGVITEKLNFNWVKMQVRWYDLEKGQNGIFWDVLDGAMNQACKKGLRVMLSVVAAPVWTMANPMPADQGQEAPPDDPQQYANFLAKILDRYPGRVGAIEIWNEENLEREWNTAGGVNPADYLTLLKTAYATIKAKDPHIIVISGGLAPTGVNCNVSISNCQPAGRPIVIDDVTYLNKFVAAGGLDYVDCVGTHSNGTNLPPTSDGAHPPARDGYKFSGPWDNPHYSWALKSQVETYAAILNGRNEQQCVTEFGYASPVDGKYPPNFGFAQDVTEQQQAQYLVDAFNWMRDSGQVKLAFLFNLDYGPKGGDPATDDNVIFSILRPNGAPRPAFDALSTMPKP
jgi:polysaccharide biosynthesis protein PslG